jgi:hypothetical protein
MKRGIEVTIRANLDDANYQVLYDSNPEKATELNIKANIEDESYTEANLIQTITDNIQWAINEFFDMEVFELIVSVDKDWRKENDN